MLIKFMTPNIVQVNDDSIPGAITITKNFIQFWDNPREDDMPIFRRENDRLPSDYTVRECHNLLTELRDHVARYESYGIREEYPIGEINYEQ